MSAAGIAAVSTLVATDVELVAAVRAGDDSAFEELYRRYHPRVGAFARRLVHDHGRAEDVTQEAFVSALRRMRQSEAPIDFKPWIFEIARNGCIDLYRRGRRAQEVSIDFEMGVAAGEVARLPGPGGPDNSLLARERLDHLCGALDELSETHHRIIVMRELEGLSYREIGERMELSPGAVESALFRARRKLQHEYSQLETGRRCTLMGTVIARLAEGLESDRDRRRLDRHARRCSNCRRSAREMGVEPMLARRGLASRVAALLPIPAFLRRRPFEGGWGGDVHSATAGVHGAAGPLTAAAGPVGVETVAAAGSKAAAVIATVALAAGGGATLGGAGPLALPGKSALEERIAERVAEAQAQARTEDHARSPLSAATEGSPSAGDGTPSALPAPALAVPALPVAPERAAPETTPAPASVEGEPPVEANPPVIPEVPALAPVEEPSIDEAPRSNAIEVSDETPAPTEPPTPPPDGIVPPVEGGATPPPETPPPAEVVPDPPEAAVPPPAETPPEPAAPPADPQVAPADAA